MKKTMMLAATLLLPVSAQAQFYPQPSYGSNVVIVPPVYPNGGNDMDGGTNMPFPSPQAGQQRLLEMLNTGGIEQPERRTTPAGCIYSGQAYSEGAMVRNEAGRQVCSPRAGAEPDVSGQVPLSWRAVPGE